MVHRETILGTSLHVKQISSALISPKDGRSLRPLFVTYLVYIDVRLIPSLTMARQGPREHKLLVVPML
jgi:hypothetical protein